jgi:hypothetical protein
VVVDVWASCTVAASSTPSGFEFTPSGFKFTPSGAGFLLKQVTKRSFSSPVDSWCRVSRSLTCNIQATFRQHSGNIQATFRQHSGNIQATIMQT